jgi:multiple sugar transport system substrate-binding protein/sn-glycerol 3-phosphate transport system substrate-binding protein
MSKIRNWILTIAALTMALPMVGNLAWGQTSLANVEPSKAEVTFWHNHSRDREKLLNEIIDLFNKTNQWRITVKGEFAGNYGQIYNKMITALAARTAPGLVVAYQNNAAAYQLADGLTDLNPYLRDSKWGLTRAELDDFFPIYLAQDVYPQFGGARLGFPPNRSMEVLFYNSDMLGRLGFAGPPKTWDEFYEMSRKATNKAAGIWGYQIRTDASNFFSQVISRGGEIARPDGSGYTLNTPQARASMEFIQKLYRDGYATKIAQPAQFSDQADFGNGKTLFTMSSTSGLPFYQQAVDAGAKFNWSIAAVPYTTSAPAMNIYGASMSVPKTTPEKQLAAWIFLKWFTEPDQMARWAIASNYFPTRKSAANSLMDYIAKNPAYKIGFDLQVYGKAEPPFAGYDNVRDAITKAMNDIIDGASVSDTLAKLDSEANKIHREARP